MKIKHFLQLIRYKNLLMLVFMMLVFKFVFYHAIPQDAIFETVLLILSVISTTTAGNIINDIFDIEIDAINKPNKNIIGTTISIKTATHLYWYFNFIGIIIGIYLSYISNKIIYSLIFIITSLLLYLYSKYLKKIMLIGNFIVSILIAISIYLVYLFDKLRIIYEFESPKKHYFLIFAFFAFILNFIREIVKDIEDLDGDYSQNMKTLPIVIGRKRTQNIIFVLSIIPLVLSMFFAFVYFKNQYLMTFYILFLIILPLGYFMYKILDIKSKKEFHKLSTLLKIIMFFGMCSILLINR